MIYDANSPLFRSFLSQKGGPSDKRKNEQKPKEQTTRRQVRESNLLEDGEPVILEGVPCV